MTAREYYKSLYLTLLTAKRDIFIAGLVFFFSFLFCSFLFPPSHPPIKNRWFVSPDVYLIRNSDRLTHGQCIAKENCIQNFEGGSRDEGEVGDGFCDGCVGGSQLGVVLGRCCERGVRVYVLIWKETKIAMDLASEYAAHALRGVSKNIQVDREIEGGPKSYYLSHSNQTKTN